ncbi:hypothetical protein I552_3247 [Mycobacterium xenopi 3993]|nr:hypothetical protein I552_3247 [Mycobacterium xenopi 3993]
MFESLRDSRVGSHRRQQRHGGDHSDFTGTQAARRRTARNEPTLGLIVHSSGAMDAAAAHARTSHGLTSTTRSADCTAVSHASLSRRAISQTTVTPPRRPASITASTGRDPTRGWCGG